MTRLSFNIFETVQLLTCWLIKMMAISLRLVYSIKVSSMLAKGVSTSILEKTECHLIEIQTYWHQRLKSFSFVVG
jgi:hypothetical protein